MSTIARFSTNDFNKQLMDNKKNCLQRKPITILKVFSAVTVVSIMAAVVLSGLNLTAQAAINFNGFEIIKNNLTVSILIISCSIIAVAVLILAIVNHNSKIEEQNRLQQIEEQKKLNQIKNHYKNLADNLEISTGDRKNLQKNVIVKKDCLERKKRELVKAIQSRKDFLNSHKGLETQKYGLNHAKLELLTHECESLKFICSFLEKELGFYDRCLINKQVLEFEEDLNKEISFCKEYFSSSQENQDETKHILLLERGLKSKKASYISYILWTAYLCELSCTGEYKLLLESEEKYKLKLKEHIEFLEESENQGKENDLNKQKNDIQLLLEKFNSCKNKCLSTIRSEGRLIPYSMHHLLK